jgi:hypothetical protein
MRWSFGQRFFLLSLPYEIDLSVEGLIENDDLLAHIRRVGKLFYRRDVN